MSWSPVWKKISHTLLFDSAAVLLPSAFLLSHTNVPHCFCSCLLGRPNFSAILPKQSATMKEYYLQQTMNHLTPKENRVDMSFTNQWLQVFHKDLMSEFDLMCVKLLIGFTCGRAILESECCSFWGFVQMNNFMGINLPPFPTLLPPILAHTWLFHRQSYTNRDPALRHFDSSWKCFFLGLFKMLIIWRRA